MVTHQGNAQRLSLDIGGISMMRDCDLDEAERGDEIPGGSRIDKDFNWKRLAHII